MTNSKQTSDGDLRKHFIRMFDIAPDLAPLTYMGVIKYGLQLTPPSMHRHIKAECMTILLESCNEQ